MADEFKYRLGTFEGKDHFVFWKAVPNLNDPEEFVVNISYRTFEEGEPENIQIVRIDNRGKNIHLDKLWEEGGPKKFLHWEGSKLELFSRALKELQNNWKKYAKKWKRNREY